MARSLKPPPDILDEQALTIYTDGSMFERPRRGGIGVLFVWVNEAGDVDTWDPSIPSTAGATNNEMELEAPIEALKRVRGGKVPVELGRFNRIVVRTDSTYVHNNIRNAMWTWRKTGWARKGGASVLNSRLWKDLIREMLAIQGRYCLLVHFEWVEGKKGEYAREVDRLAKESAKSPSFGRARPSIVTRKTTKARVEVGSVKVEGQTFAIRVIQAQYLAPPRRGSRYKYEVVEPEHRAFGRVDWAESDHHLRRGHTYLVRMNDRPSNPRIEEVVRDIEEDLTPYENVLVDSTKPLSASEVAKRLNDAGMSGVSATSARLRLDRLVQEGRARRTRGAGSGRPFLYEKGENTGR